MKLRRVLEIGWTVAFLAGPGLGCGGSSSGPKSPGGTGPIPRDTRIVHEDCALDDSDAVSEDINGDGRPDRTTLNEGGRATCRRLDFNFDGLVDAWVYLDERGQVRRRESDYDRDGRIDEVALYEGGVLTERQRATTLSGKLDTWQHYRAGKVASAERDSNGDEYVDQWWEYPDQRPPECPLIHSDVNGDGRPDPGATVDVCKDRYVPTARDGSKPGAEPEEGEAPLDGVPTELDPAAPDATPTEAAEPAPAGEEGQP
jgi:hypothetical protein